MFIESLIKRPNAPINLGGRDYFFRPLDNNPQSPHVCEVTEIAHAQRLLSITEGYRAYELPTVQRAQAPEAPQLPPPTGALTDEQRERVSALLGSSVTDLRAAVPSIEDLAVLTAMLDTESARTSPPPRTTVLTLVGDRIAKLTPPA